jgi:hypothetical protein
MAAHYITVRKPYTRICQFIYIGRSDINISGTPQRICPLIVGKKEKDIWPVLGKSNIQTKK